MAGAVFICAGCGDAAALRAALLSAGSGLHPAPATCLAACLGACATPGVIAFRAPGRAAFVFRDVVAADAADIAAFARLWEAAHRGEVHDARSLGALRHKLAARIPALPDHDVATGTRHDAAAP